MDYCELENSSLPSCTTFYALLLVWLVGNYCIKAAGISLHSGRRGPFAGDGVAAEGGIDGDCWGQVACSTLAALEHNHQIEASRPHR